MHSDSHPDPWPFREGRGLGGGTAVAGNRLVQPGAEFWPSILDVTLRNWQEYFSGGSPNAQ